MIKMLFSDLDGTLLYMPPLLTSGVSEENRRAILKLQASQVRFGIATGRSVNFLSQVFAPDLQFDTVGMCGATIRHNGKTLYETDFDHDEIESLLEIFGDNRYENRFLCVTAQNEYIFADPQQAHDYLSNDNGHIRDCKEVLLVNLADYVKNKANSHINSCFCWFNGPEGVEYYKDMLKRRFANRYQIVQSSPHSIVIMKDGANKGTGIAKIAMALGYSLDEIAVVGDSENDFEMFAMVQHSFCVDHARPDIQAKAAYIVHSVAECVEMILKMNEQERLENCNLY